MHLDLLASRWQDAADDVWGEINTLLVRSSDGLVMWLPYVGIFCHPK